MDETICCGAKTTTFAVQLPTPGERTRCNLCRLVVDDDGLPLGAVVRDGVLDMTECWKVQV